MKQIKNLALALLIIGATSGWAQEVVEESEIQFIEEDKPEKWQKDEIKTIAKDGHSGGFGAFTFKGTKFRDANLVITGLRGGWIINRSLAIGFEGHGIIPTAKFDNISATGKSVILGGYGGMFLEPVIFSNEIIHFTFPISGGAGWLGYHEDWEQNTDNSKDLIDDDVFWYIEPGVSAELNVSKHFRIAAGVSKRFTQDLELIMTNSNDFEGMSYFITFKFGKF